MSPFGYAPRAIEMVVLLCVGSVAFLILEKALKLVEDFALLQLVEGVNLLNLGIKGACKCGVRIVVRREERGRFGVGRCGGGLMDGFLEGVNAVEVALATLIVVRLSYRAGSQLLEIAVGDVMAAPIRHRIELDRVGELHRVVDAQQELLELRRMLQRSPRVSIIGLLG